MTNKMKGVTSQEIGGKVYWYARVDGRREPCGEGEKGRRMAVAARGKEVSRQYENREMGAGLRVRKAHFKTVSQLAEWYMALPSTCVPEARCNHVLAYFGKSPVGRIEAHELETYRLHRKEQGAADGTINNELSLLRTMYNKAVKTKKLHAGAVPGEFVMVDDAPPRRTITEDEYKRLLAASDQDFSDLLVCAYESAMRSNEICKLTAGQVHLNKTVGISGGDRVKADFIDLGIFDTKTRTRRTVPVSPELKKVLRRRLRGLEPEDRVFTYLGRGGRKLYTRGQIAYRMERVCDLAGVPYGDKLLNAKGERVGVVFHCFRHTRTTKWVEMGFSDEIIRRATGHSSLAAYQKYIKLGPAAVMRLVDYSDFKVSKKCQGHSQTRATG